MVLTKAEVRAEALAKRDAVPAAARQAFADRLAALGPRLVLDYAPPNPTLVVALFDAIGSEPDLRACCAALAAAGVPTALPSTGARGASLTFRAWQPGDATVAGPFGIREPASHAELLDPDVLFVPLAAFDRRGHRIGSGGGYYDRTLAELRARKRVRAIGIAYSAQEVLFLPSEPHDQPLDLVVTERDILLCEA